MAQDYNIYIHGDGGSGGDGIASKFVPTESQQTGGSLSDKFLSGFQKAQKAVQVVSNAGQSAIGALAKVVPWVAIIKAVVTIADKVTTVVENFKEDYMGNYTHSVQYNNVKRGLSFALNPTFFLTENIKTQLGYVKENVKINQERQLIGSSTLRNRGIGV